MICSCGARYPDSDKRCTYCGAQNAEYKPPEPVKQTAPETDQQFNPWDAFPGKQPPPEQNPNGQNANRQTSFNDQNYPPWGQNRHEHEHDEDLARLANTSAIISLVCGILGNIIAGPIFGTIAIFQGRKAKRLGYLGGKATAGVVLGIVAIVFWLFFMFLLFYVIPRNAPHLIPYFEQFFPI